MAHATGTKHNAIEITRTPMWLCALNWLAARDQSYRAAQKLRDMPVERLEDMGLTREDTRSAFKRGKAAASGRLVGLKRMV